MKLYGRTVRPRFWLILSLVILFVIVGLVLFVIWVMPESFATSPYWQAVFEGGM